MFDTRVFALQDDIQHESVDYSFTDLPSEKDVVRESYFMQTVKFLKELDEEVLEGNKNFYTSLLESGGEQVLVHEAFSEFVNWIKKIINKVLDFIKALFNKFIVGLNMIVKREKYLKDHEKDFSKFDDDEHSFTMKIFNFTLDVNCPSNDPLAEYQASLDSISSGTNIKALTGGDATDKDKMLAALSADYDDYMANINNDYYDKKRGEILTGKKDYAIDATDYSKELFAIFRDGEDEKEETDIHSTQVNEALLYFKKYSDLKKKLEKDKKEIEKKYKSIEKSLNGSLSKETSKIKLGDQKEYGFYDEKFYNKLDTYVKAKANEIEQISSIHTMAYSAKLDAAKDCMNQSKAILYKALYRIKGNIRNGEREPVFEDVQ